jgi:hypothetical protein
MRFQYLPLKATYMRYLIIMCLKTKGLDYSKSPIPDWVVEWAQKEYPNNWKEYTSTY